ncbi:MAG: DUF2971 domain-containing protein [Alphaproteobacteria bacterium]|nr:DUF2971 domain-containing protein [Alphaproteobacteria bacterium]
MLKALVSSIYLRQPTRLLFHYTTLKGLMGIVEAGAIWGTDYRYLNDSAEIEHFLDVLDAEIAKRLPGARDARDASLQSDATADTSGSLEQQQGYRASLMRAREAVDREENLEEFRRWLRAKKVNEGAVFVASFIENGDLLSQWRGYTPFGKGVSIGFDPKELLQAASAASVRMGGCIYDAIETAKIAGQIVDVAETLAESARASNDFEKAFDGIQTDLFEIAALIKHPKFEEEREWRMVRTARSANSIGANFREGPTSLIPYIEIPLPRDGRPPAIKTVVVGPTSTPELSKASMDHFIRSQGIVATVDTTGIPYRGR